MFNTETKERNWKPCKKHRWPKHGPGSFIQTIGNVHYEQCNNCLSMRIKFETDILADNKWVRLTEIQVVEPSFGVIHNEKILNTTS